MDLIWAELVAELPDPVHLVRMTIRLFVAMLVGAVVGLQRQSAGQSAGDTDAYAGRHGGRPLRAAGAVGSRDVLE
jgi:hypothetical protein